MTLFRYLFLIVGLLGSAASNASEQPDGEELLTQRCLVCHGDSQTEENRLAPPIIAVKQRYMRQYPNKVAFVDAVKAWARAPSETRSLMRGALGKFGLMPALPYSDADLVAIAEYIYEGNMSKPAGFDEHQKDKHGKKEP